jgi:uncharacterized protein (TIGR03435 family)
MPLSQTLMRAYLPKSLQRSALIRGGPEWLRTEAFDFVGKVAPEQMTQWNQERSLQMSGATGTLLQAMLQSALRERCNLEVTRSPAQVEGFALVVGKRGLNKHTLVSASSSGAIPSDAVDIFDNGHMIPISSEQQPHLTFVHTSMASLAAEMTALNGIPIQDQTGLSGYYDFAISRPSALDVGTQADVAPLPIHWDFASLGLELKPVTITVDAVTISHIERPTPN